MPIRKSRCFGCTNDSYTQLRKLPHSNAFRSISGGRNRNRKIRQMPDQTRARRLFAIQTEVVSYIYIYLKVSDIRSVSRGGTSSLRSPVITIKMCSTSKKRIHSENLNFRTPTVLNRTLVHARNVNKHFWCQKWLFEYDKMAKSLSSSTGL